MRKSLLKRAWKSLLYGAGRDVLAVAIAGAMMLSESPVGYLRYAYADEPEQVEQTNEATEGEQGTAEEQPKVEEPAQSAPETSQPTLTAEQTQAGSETTPQQESKPAEESGLEDGSVILSAELFGEIEFASLFLVDKDGNVDHLSTPLSQDDKITVTDQYDFHFMLKADENYVIDTVSYRVGDGASTELSAKNDVYTIPSDIITKANQDGQAITLEVESHAVAAKIDVDLRTYALYGVNSDDTKTDSPIATVPTTNFNVPTGSDFAFVPELIAGYTLESVEVQIGSDTTELVADENGIYTISASQLDAAGEKGEEVELVVDTEQDGDATTGDSTLPVPVNEDITFATTELMPMMSLMAASPLALSSREFDHNLETYLDKNYDTSAYGVSGIKINGVDIDEVTSIAYGDTISLRLAWGFPNTMAVRAGDQFTYQLPDSISWAFDSGAAQGKVTDEAGLQVGTFVIDENGLATITYSSDLGSNVVGSFSVEGVITRVHNIGDNALVSFSLAGRNWNLTYVSGESKVEVTKTGGEYVPNASDFSLRQFTLDVFSLGENENIVVTDTPSTVTINSVTSTTLQYVEDSLQVFSDEACTEQVSDGRVSVVTNEDGTFDFNISQMGDFEHLYIRYQARVTLEAYNGLIGRSWNFAAAGPGEGYDRAISSVSNTAMITKSETSTVDVPSLYPSYIRQKTGTYSATDRAITWSVTAVTGDITLTLQDKLGAGLEPIRDIHLYESSDAGKTYTEVDLSVARNLTPEGLLDGSATLPSSTSAGGQRYFKITYVTDVDPYYVGRTSYENRIIGNGRIFINNTWLGGWVTVDTGTRVTVEKTSSPRNSYVNYDSDGTVTGSPEGINWVSHVSVPDSLNGNPYTNFSITDLEKNAQNSPIVENSVHIYTDAELTNEVTSNFTISYTHDTYNNGKTSYCNGFVITSSTFTGGDLYVTAKATIKGVNNATYTNTFTVDAKEFAATTGTGYHYVNAHRLSKRADWDVDNHWRTNGWSHTNSNTGVVTWEIQVGGFGNGELDLNPDITITDTAPDRLVVVPDSFRFVTGSIDGWHDLNGGWYYVEGISAEVKGTSTIVFHIAPGSQAYQDLKAGKSLVLTYDTTYNPDYHTDGFTNQTTDKVTNTVSLQFGEHTSDTTSASFTFKGHDLLVKQATYDESTAPNALFTIECNYWAGDLDPNSDYLVLTDEAGSALSINTNSITVTTYDRTGKVTNDAVPIADMASQGFSFTRDIKSGVVTFTVPDSLHFALNYESLVTLAPGTTIEDDSASNSVTLAGYTTPVSTGIGSQIHTSRATTTSIGYGVMVEKIDADFTSLHVADATYAVQRVDVERDGGSWRATNYETIGTVTTAESGFSQAMTGLAADQVYRLIETESPVGYDLSDDVFYLVFQGAQGDETIDYDQVTLRDADGNEVELEVYSSDSATKRILMSDHQTPGSLVITKASEGADTPAGTTFTVTGKSNSYAETFTYGQFTDGTLTIDGLVPGDYIITENKSSAERNSYQLEVYTGDPTGETPGTQQTVTVYAGVEGQAPAEANFTNVYTRVETEVNVRKTWVGPVPEGAEVTVHLLADGSPLDPDQALVLSAENDWHATFEQLPIYSEDDGHAIEYDVREDSYAGYTSEVMGDALTGYTVTNTFDARATVEATKYAYGRQGVYGFTLTAADAEGTVRSSEGAGTFESTGAIIDTGQAFTLRATTGAYDGESKSAVTFPEISYREPGDYYYLLTEDAVQGEPYDDSVYLVHVSVAADEPVSVSYTLQGEGTEAESAEFYNNGGLMLFGRSAAFAAETDLARTAFYEPVAQKVLEGLDSRLLQAGEFSFLLTDEAGNSFIGTNDADGTVVFHNSPDSDATARFSYDEPGEYRYTISEIDSGQSGIEYDSSVHDVVVTVVEGESGELEVSNVSYSVGGEPEEIPTFTNAVEVVTIGIQKVSREGEGAGEPLLNSVYGLWIEGADGHDIYLGNDASDDEGYIYIENVPVDLDATYYFKEESAPEGHLVDPYRCAYFHIVKTDGGYRLEYLD